MKQHLKNIQTQTTPPPQNRKKVKKEVYSYNDEKKKTLGKRKNEFESEQENKRRKFARAFVFYQSSPDINYWICCTLWDKIRNSSVIDAIIAKENKKREKVEDKLVSHFKDKYIYTDDDFWLMKECDMEPIAYISYYSWKDNCPLKYHGINWDVTDLDK